MNTDRFIRTANKKMICEDYAIAGEFYITLSDGCSSSENTDIGSRLLCHAFSSTIMNGNVNRNIIESSLAGQLEAIEEFLGDLPLSYKDATLLIAVEKYVKNIPKCFDIFTFGDGNIIVVYKNGSVRHIKIDFEHNAPYYFSYMLDERRNNQYVASFCNKNVLTKNVIDTTYYDIKDVETLSRTYHNIKYNDINDYSFLASNVSYIILASDGIFSWIDENNQPQTEYEVIRNIASIKNHKGFFIQRRMNKICQEYTEKGYHNYDDISVVAIANF